MRPTPLETKGNRATDSAYSPGGVEWAGRSRVKVDSAANLDAVRGLRIGGANKAGSRESARGSEASEVCNADAANRTWGGGLKTAQI